MEFDFKWQRNIQMSLQVRMQADDFFRAYQVLEKNYNAATLAIMGPSVVCLAFAVELYLKDLHIVLTGKAPRIHNINKLFEKLPPAVKQEIFAHKSISQNPFMTRGNIFSSEYYSRTYTLEDRFIDRMKAISDGFEKWRYSYESATLKYESSFAIALIEAVASTTDNMRQQNYKTLKGQSIK
jgi:HEPN domain-containing protein